MSLTIQGLPHAKPLVFASEAKIQQPAISPAVLPDSFQARDIRFSSITPYTYAPEKNLLADLKKRAEQNPDDIALSVDASNEPGEISVKLTHKELYNNALRIGRALKEKYNLKPGDRIGAIETNSPEFVQLFFGALSAGVSMASVNTLALSDPMARTPKMKHMISVADLKVLFVGKDPLFKSFEQLKPSPSDLVNETYKGAGLLAKTFIHGYTKAGKKLKSDLDLKLFMLERAEKGMKIVTSQGSDNFNAMLKFNPLDEKDVQLDAAPDSEAMVLYTSGTTANPKAVPISHKSLVHTVEALKDMVGSQLSRNDKFYMVLPLFHIFGMAVFLLGLSSNAKMLLLPSLKDALKKEDKPKAPNKTWEFIRKMLLIPSPPPVEKPAGPKNQNPILKTIQDEKVTVTAMIPGILNGLLRDDKIKDALQSIRFIVSGGEKLPKDMREKFNEVCPDGEIWDGYGSTETGILTLNTSDESGHVGKPISPFVAMELRNPTPEGSGELWVNTPSGAQSYIGGTPHQNDELFKGNGWIKTEDTVAFDDKGNLKIVGRAAMIIKRNGEKLSPDDFDARLKESLKIKHAITVPYHPGGGEVEKVVSVVLVDPASADDEKSLRDTLQKKVDSGAFAPRYLPHYVIPIKAKELPEGFISPAGKTMHKTVIAFVQNLEKTGAIKLGKTLEIKKPDVLGLKQS